MRLLRYICLSVFMKSVSLSAKTGKISFCLTKYFILSDKCQAKITKIKIITYRTVLQYLGFSCKKLQSADSCKEFVKTDLCVTEVLLLSTNCGCVRAIDPLTVATLARRQQGIQGSMLQCLLYNKCKILVVII